MHVQNIVRKHFTCGTFAFPELSSLKCLLFLLQIVGAVKSLRDHWCTQKEGTSTHRIDACALQLKRQRNAKNMLSKHLYCIPITTNVTPLAITYVLLTPKHEGSSASLKPAGLSLRNLSVCSRTYYPAQIIISFRRY